MLTTPWTDRAGRLSPIKAVTFAATLVPALLIVEALWSGRAGPRPITYVIHETGDWAVIFVIAGLAVTPLRRIADLPKLILVRRMLGLTALSYALAHFTTYIVDQQFDLAKVASEIVLRTYLTIGFVALLGLVALGATSTDAAIRAMGRNWVRLHKVVYAIATLGLLHYFMQSKIDVSSPTIYAGLFVVLMSYRVAHARGWPYSPTVLAVIAIFGALATMALEYAWFAIATGVPAEKVFAANFSWAAQLRPAWWVFTAATLVAVVGTVRGGGRSRRPARPLAMERATAR